MSRFLIFVYGIVSYVIGLGGLVFFILYAGGWNFLPFHIDSTPPGSPGIAILINLSLMALFAVQHSVMAREGFKRRLTKIIPPAAERSTYVLLSGLVLVLICFCWQPIRGTLWHVENPIARGVLTVFQLMGWALVVLASFLINHFELFGLQQIYFNLIHQPEPKPNFTDRFLYKFVRHPLQLGVLIGIWSAPTMTMTHLILSLTMTLYIFVGLHYEEKDLAATLGQDYTNYQKRVRMILPIPKR